MNPVESLKSFYSNAFNFKGRACRSEFWWFVLFSAITIRIMRYVDREGYIGSCRGIQWKNLIFC